MNALCLGGADCVWDDVVRSEAILGARWWDIVVAANDVGCHWEGPLDHWVSLHPERFTHPDGWENPDGPPHGWLELRRRNGHPGGYVTWAKHRRRLHNVDRVMTRWMGGSSGKLAIDVAREVGAARVVVCGMPMDARPHFAESTVHDGDAWTSSDSHWRGWRRDAENMAGTVKSMSGRSRRLLGEPTPEWLQRPTEEAA